MVTRDVFDFVGYWKIVHMEVWAAKYIDAVVPGYIEFNYGDDLLTGTFQIGTVLGELDCALREIESVTFVEWSWEGRNDNDPGSGRGWARLVDRDLVGRIFIHGGDNSEFRAKKRQPAAPQFPPGEKGGASSKPH